MPTESIPSQEQIDAARERVKEKRAKVHEAKAAKRSKSKDTERVKTMDKIKEEERRLDAELQSIESGGVQNPLPAPTGQSAPPPPPSQSESGSKADTSKKDGDS